jgi:hypothetical protein
MLRYRLLILIFSCLVACRFDPGGITASDAVPGGDTNPPDAPPDCNNECVSDGALLCDADGNVVECPLGCDDTGGEPRCRDIVPSNGASDTHLMDVTAGLTIRNGETGTIGTDTGAVTVNGIVVRPLGPGVVANMGHYQLSASLSVLAVSSLLVESGGTLRIDGARALIILSSGDVTIDGLVDISGGCPTGTPECPGPGGGGGATSALGAGGCAPGVNGFGGSGSETGGGGGGLGAPGAPGGDGLNRTGGAGGAIDGCPEPALEGLRGGSGGGLGGESGVTGSGGGGGGALQITSKTRIVFMAGGAIWAGGGGGGPGIVATNTGGGGGGSGGAILLEAPIVKAAGAILTANGGGGGGGGDVGAMAGEKGTRTTAQAAGGAGGLNGGNDYRGGPGGALAGAAGQGNGGGDGTGGGGGGVGIIRINAPAAFLDLANAIISPEHTRGDPASQ